MNNLDGWTFKNRKPRTPPSIATIESVHTSALKPETIQPPSKHVNKIENTVVPVIPSMLSNIFSEFMIITTHRTVNTASIAKICVTSIFVPVNMKIIPHEICTSNLMSGFVLYASSAKPIIKAKLPAINKPVNSNGEAANKSL